MNLLAFDTSAAHVAAALHVDGTLVQSRLQPMKRGQAEQLMPTLEEMLGAQGLSWRTLDAIGVGIGPGNFTGIRISVSAARGLALGLGVPAIGVDRFDLIDHLSGGQGLACVPATQDRLYIRQSGAVPRLAEREDAEALGLALQFEPEGFNPAPLIAQIAATRLSADHPRPAPLYIKEADAAPARDAPPRLIP